MPKEFESGTSGWGKTQRILKCASSVRMCDRCGTVFSERAEGWSTFAGSRRMKNQESGKFEQVTEQMDSCPDCSDLMLTPQRPELLPSQTSPHYETKE